MCGIVGYTGARQAQPILLNCLGLLEYRGYDSCGIAVGGRTLEVYKDAVRVEALKQSAPRLSGKTGIGHTRWATHGAPSLVNSHPHLDCSRRFAVVHNGVIHNYEKLKQKLAAEGHKFVSDTDTEVIPHLIEKYFRDDILAAVEAALAELEGSYAIIVMAAGNGRLVAARRDSPLVIGLGDRENFIASDVPAILNFTDRVVYLEDGDVGIISTDGVKVKQQRAEVVRTPQKISWAMEDAKKAGYEHFMLKEIHEQPKVIRDTLASYLAATEPFIDVESLKENFGESMLLIACGSSYHAALVGKHALQDLLKIPVTAELASEFTYSGQSLHGTMVVAITQSGETADTLRAMKRLKEGGCHLTAVTNVVDSSACRLADQIIYTRAGPEISVAATKSFIAELVALYWLGLTYSRIDASRREALLAELRHLPSRVQELLDDQAQITDCAGYLAGYKNVFFIGRGINYPVALEGALKLKEITYLHAEGYAAGELKHGPFALLDEGTPVIAIAARDSTYDAMLTNIKEVKARRSPLIAIAEAGDEDIEKIADRVINIPKTEAIFSAVTNTVALQLLAYHTARRLDRPIDFPRNLAKSVTVE